MESIFNEENFWDFGGAGSEGVEQDSWWSGVTEGAGEWFTDLGKSALSDLTSAGKDRIQTEIKNALSGGDSSKISKNDTGDLHFETDQSDRTGLMPSTAIPTSALPTKPGTVSNFSIEKYTPFILMGIAGIAGLIILKKFL